VEVVSAAAALQMWLSGQPSCYQNSQRTHYKDPISQAISLWESPLRFEFFMSDAHALGRSEPLAWNDSNSKMLDT
jgi:hypothetical protein